MAVADTIKQSLKSLRPIVRERFASDDPVERQWAVDFIGEWLEEQLENAGTSGDRAQLDLLPPALA